MEIRPLLPGDDVAAFTCGDVDLDRYLREQALEQAERHHAPTLVAVEDDAILGYVTFCAGAVANPRAPLAYRRPSSFGELPTFVIKRLGVLPTRRREGIGARLLVRALAHAVAQARVSGCAFVDVEALPSSVPFYSDLGFERYAIVGDEREPDCVLMYLPIEAVEDAFRR